LTLSLSELAARRLRHDVSVEQGQAEYTERRNRLVLAAVQRQKGQRKKLLQWAGLLAALGLGGLAGWYVLAADAAASFTAAGSPGRIGAFYAAPPLTELPLRFGDDSQLALAAGSHARVLRSGAGRRSLVLEAGAVRARLEPHYGWTWEMAAGPYLLQTSQGVFDVIWDAAAQTLTVNLQSGPVRVSGPGLGEGKTLTPGERLVQAVTTARP
jgi:hypothetical protein